MTERNNVVGAVPPADVATLLADETTAGRWVLDPAGASVEFAVKHFWGAITVRGSFSHLTGEASVDASGTITGLLTIDASSLSTGNKQRDKHLLSADFFDVEGHPNVIVTVTGAKPSGAGTLACTGTLEAAGHVQPLEFTAQVQDAAEHSVVLRAEVTVDRTAFDMTWSPLRIAAPLARATVVARFVRP